MANTWTHAACGLALTVTCASAQTITNGDFELGPPSLTGWSSLGAVEAKQPGRSNGHSAWLGPAVGIPVQQGGFYATTIWQTVKATDPTAQTFGRFERSAFAVNAKLYVEVHGPAGIYAGEVPQFALFESFEWSYPAGEGDLLVAFTFIEKMPSPSPQKIIGGCKIDDVEVKQDVVGFLDPARPPKMITLTMGWPKRNSTDQWDKAFTDVHDRRNGALRTITSPKGYRTNEGNSSHGPIVFSQPRVTYQQIDGTHKGTAFPNLKAIAFRRDYDSATNTAFASRTIRLDIHLGTGDPQRFSPNFRQNFTVGAPTQVFLTKNINLPSWATKPTNPSPSPFDVRFPFDTPWSYSGTDPLIYQLDVYSNSLGPNKPFINYPIDFQTTSGSFKATKNVGEAVGTGCTTIGNSGPFTLNLDYYNHSFKTRIKGSMKDAPSSVDTLMFLSLTNPNAKLSGVCSTIYATPLLRLPTGKTSSTGTRNFEFDRLPYDPAALGKWFYFQANGADFTQAGLPIALSNGIKVKIPSPPTFPDVGRVYRYTSYSNRTSTFGPSSGALITAFEY